MVRKDDAMRDPEAVFEHPQRVLENRHLSVEQKISVLEQWKDELIQRQAAEAENMGATATDPDLLKDVSNALEHLRSK